MKGCRALGVLALVLGGLTLGIRAQQRESDLSKPKVLPLLSCLRLDEQGGFQLVGANQARLDEQLAQAQCRAGDRS